MIPRDAVGALSGSGRNDCRPPAHTKRRVSTSIRADDGEYALIGARDQTVQRKYRLKVTTASYSRSTQLQLTFREQGQAMEFVTSFVLAWPSTPARLTSRTVHEKTVEKERIEIGPTYRVPILVSIRGLHFRKCWCVWDGSDQGRCSFDSRMFARGPVSDDTIEPKAQATFFTEQSRNNEIGLLHQQNNRDRLPR